MFAALRPGTARSAVLHPELRPPRRCAGRLSAVRRTQPCSRPRRDWAERLAVVARRRDRRDGAHFMNGTERASDSSRYPARRRAVWPQDLTVSLHPPRQQSAQAGRNKHRGYHGRNIRNRPSNPISPIWHGRAGPETGRDAEQLHENEACGHQRPAPPGHSRIRGLKLRFNLPPSNR